MSVGPLQIGTYSSPGNSGGGYAPGDTGLIVQGGNQSASFVVVTVGIDGDVASYTITSGGSGYDDTGGPFSLSTINIIGTGSGFEVVTPTEVPVNTGGTGYGNSVF